MCKSFQEILCSGARQMESMKMVPTSLHSQRVFQRTHQTWEKNGWAHENFNKEMETIRKDKSHKAEAYNWTEKNTLEGFNNRLYEAKERTSQLKDMAVELIQSGKQKEKKNEKKWRYLKGLTGQHLHYRDLKRKREKRAEILFEEIMAKNFPACSEWPSLKSLQITNAGEGVEKRKLSYTIGGNASWCSHYGKQYRVSSEN